jgi:hypothetical protein
MSKPNKVNKSNYDQGGRLTPDEFAREYKKQEQASPTSRDERVRAKSPQPRAERDDTHPQSEREESE